MRGFVQPINLHITGDYCTWKQPWYLQCLSQCLECGIDCGFLFVTCEKKKNNIYLFIYFDFFIFFLFRGVVAPMAAE